MGNDNYNFEILKRTEIRIYMSSSQFTYFQSDS